MSETETPDSPPQYAGGELNVISPAPEGEKEITEWTKIKKNLGICALVIGFIMGIVSIVMASEAWNKINEYTNEFQSMVDSWREPSVVDVLFGEMADCPEGYKEPLVRGNWGGVSDACNCLHETHPNKSFESSPYRSCDQEERDWGCFTAWGVPSVDTPFFPDGTRLCYKTGKLNALGRADYNSRTDSCPTGNRTCGNATAGEYAFCWPEADPCPITDVFFSTFNDESEAEAWANTTKNVAGYQWSAATNMAMFYSRGGIMGMSSDERTSSSFPIESIPQLGYPAIGFRYQSGLPCYLASGYGYPGRGSEYGNQIQAWRDLPQNYQNGNKEDFTRGIALRTGDSGCGSKVRNVTSQGWDVRFFPVVGRSEYDIYLPFATMPGDPPPAPHVGGKIPYMFMPIANRSFWYITMETEVQWADDDCSKSKTEVEGNASDVAKLREAQLALFTILVLTFVLIAVIGTCVEIYFKCNDDDGKIEKGEDGYKFLCCWKVLKWALKIGAYICVIVSIAIALGLVGFFDAITAEVKPGGELYCSDDLSMNGFAKMKTIMDEVSHRDIVAGFTSMGDFLGDIVTQILHTCT